MIALIPIILVLILAIRTKDIYFSLLIGIFTALFIFTGFNPFTTVTTFTKVLSDVTSGYIDILLYVALIGLFIYLIEASGAPHAFAEKLINKLKTKKQTIIVSTLLGILCFVDDYFSLLVVDSVMSPIADKNGMSREKLAYIADATAGPICLITPMSSWVGLIAASLPLTSQIDGYALYIKTIPFNLYAWLTLVFIFVLAFMKIDFGRMKKLEAKVGDKEMKKSTIITKAKPKDLILPIIISVIATILCFLYSGGFFSGASLTQAFADCNSLASLNAGMIITLLSMAVLYIPRKILTPKKFVESITEGFKFISPALLILLLAWSFSMSCGMDYLNFTGWVADLITNSHLSFVFLPALLFISCFILTLSSGSSWTAMGLLIPLASLLFNDTVSPLMILSTAAILSGGAAGDHLGPLNDTTVLSATFAQANYPAHVVSQLHYGLIVVAISFIGFLIAGISGLYWTGILFGLVTIPLILFIIKHRQLRRS